MTAGWLTHWPINWHTNPTQFCWLTNLINWRSNDWLRQHTGILQLTDFIQCNLLSEFIGWLTIWLTNWQTLSLVWGHWVTDCLIDWLTDRHTNSLTVSSSITLLLKNDYESCVIHILLPSKWTLSLKNTVNIFLINLKLNNSFQWFTGWSLLTLTLHWWQMDHCDGSFHLYSVLTWIGFGQIPAGYIHHA